MSSGPGGMSSGPGGRGRGRGGFSSGPGGRGRGRDSKPCVVRVCVCNNVCVCVCVCMCVVSSGPGGRVCKWIIRVFIRTKIHFLLYVLCSARAWHVVGPWHVVRSGYAWPRRCARRTWTRARTRSGARYEFRKKRVISVRLTLVSTIFDSDAHARRARHHIQRTAVCSVRRGGGWRRDERVRQTIS